MDSTSWRFLLLQRRTIMGQKRQNNPEMRLIIQANLRKVGIHIADMFEEELYQRYITSEGVRQLFISYLELDPLTCMDILLEFHARPKWALELRCFFGDEIIHDQSTWLAKRLKRALDEQGLKRTRRGHPYVHMDTSDTSTGNDYDQMTIPSSREVASIASQCVPMEARDCVDAMCQVNMQAPDLINNKHLIEEIWVAKQKQMMLERQQFSVLHENNELWELTKLYESLI